MSHRILLYGASNLWLSRRAALTEIRKRFAGYLEIGLAHGPGRSYGLKAGNPLVRYEPLHSVDFGFPGDVSGEKVALLTDIGNDIAYAQPPDRVVEWVNSLTARLREDGYRIVVGGIPSKSLALLNPKVFQTLARFYYSDSSASRELITRNLEEVESGVREICRLNGLPFVELNPDWYSYDRFHLKGSACSSYWHNLLDEFPVRHRFDSRWSLAVRRPLFPRKYWLAGKERQGVEHYSGLVPHSTTRVR